MAVDLLLEAATDIVHGGGAEFHDVEGVNDGLGVGEFVVDGVLVAVERIQGGDLTPVRNTSPRSSSQVL